MSRGLSRHTFFCRVGWTLAGAAVGPVPLLTRAGSAELAGSTVAALPYWLDAMKAVHATFQGQTGYVAQFGDSITYSMAFWTPIGWDEPDRYLIAADGLPKRPKEKRWRDTLQGFRAKGPEQGNYSGWRVGDVLKALDAVLEHAQPELTILMVGTNDISGGTVPESYREQLKQVVRKCLAAHCVPILNTIPPRRGRDEAVQTANQVIRAVAREGQVPLADFYAECLRLRPGQTWDKTIISEDGIHPSGGQVNVYTEENMKSCGYALRNWVNFLAVREIYFRVLAPPEEQPDHSKNEPSPPSEFSATYRWVDPGTCELETRVRALADLSGFESFAASYFAQDFDSASVYVQNRDPNVPHPRLLATEASLGQWLMAPRDTEAVQLIRDGRWKLEPNPVDWVILPPLAAPLAVRRNRKAGVVATLMARPRDCFAVAMPHQTEGHFSVYFSLFGVNLKADEQKGARLRLGVGGIAGDTDLIQGYDKLLASGFR